MKKQHLHEWEWNNPPIALDCKKCGEYLDCGNIVEHMNELEVEVASLRKASALMDSHGAAFSELAKGAE